MQKRKFRIANETQSEMSFEQPASSAVLQSLPEADLSKAPIERVTYAMKPVAGDIHLSAEIAVISGSSPEKKIDISQGLEAQNVQTVLDKIAGKQAEQYLKLEVKIRHTLYLVSSARRPYSAPNTDQFGVVFKSLDILELSEAKIDLLNATSRSLTGLQCVLRTKLEALNAERLVGMLASDALELWQRTKRLSE
jgi:hypothetical protein